MIKWNEKFSVGYKVFDEQHIKLIEILNDVEFLIKDKSIHNDLLYDRLNVLFSELVDYTVYHFETEEKVFDQKSYPLAEEHKELHRIFVENVKEKLSGFKLGKDERKVALEIYNMLLDWLMNHIVGSDKKYMGKLD
ncbi:MAG TPA: bacteriohemerythrin [Clostridia bacterium]|nr:bacteriohemerythrin [Clostridia bacterium]